MSTGYIAKLRKPETIEEKYKVAVNALQAISQYDKEWSTHTLQNVAANTLTRLGEETVMKNKYESMEGSK